MQLSLRNSSVTVALAAVVAVFVWQAATVHFNYGGNWSALFCTGAKLGIAPAVANEKIHLFPDAAGWDGQFYHYIAHDPWIQRDLWKSIDAPRLRYRRILLPATAHLLALGQAAWIDWSYRLVVLGFTFAGVYWVALLAGEYGRSRWWGLAFLLLPATLVSIDRMAVDVALAALCLGFVWYGGKGRQGAALYAVLVLAGLARDTGLLLALGWCAWLLWKRQWGRALVFATAAIPAAAWYAYVAGHTLPFRYHALFSLPFTGMLHRVTHPMPYPFAPALNALLIGLDWLAVGGVLAMIALTIRAAWQIRMHAVSVVLAAVCFMAVINWYPGDWLETYDYGRIFSPALALLALRGMETGTWSWCLPLLLILPRIALQFGSQVYGVLRGIF